MRFITEYDLRNEYKKSPFKVYTINEDCRLTPGAKQFLTDFMIKIKDDKDDEDMVDTSLDDQDQDLEVRTGGSTKAISLKIKKLALKANKCNPIIGEKLNSLSISLYQGHLSFTEVDIIPDDAYDKLIYIDLDDPCIEFYLSLIDLDYEIKARIKEIRTCKQRLEDENLQKKADEKLELYEGLRFTLYTQVKEEEGEEEYLC